MAKGQMRSTKEKRKPKAEKDKPKQLSAYKLSQMQGSSVALWQSDGKEILIVTGGLRYPLSSLAEAPGPALPFPGEYRAAPHITRRAIERDEAGALALLCRVVSGPILLELAARITFVPVGMPPSLALATQLLPPQAGTSAPRRISASSRRPEQGGRRFVRSTIRRAWS